MSASPNVNNSVYSGAAAPSAPPNTTPVGNPHYGEADDQSVLTAFEPSDQSDADISAALIAHVKGCDIQRGNTERMSAITSAKLLSGLIPGSSEDATGRCLYRTICQLLKQLGPFMDRVTRNNFDLRGEYTRISALRNTLNVAITQAEIASSLPPKAPSDVTFNISLEVGTHDKLEQLEEETPSGQAPFEKAADRKAHIASELEAYVHRRKREFLEEYRLYEAASAVHRQAVERLPQLKAERSSLIVLESYIDSLISYQRAIVTRIVSTLGGDAAGTQPHLVSIQVRLKSKANLHNEEVVDPLTSFHLPGILFLLHTNYCVESLHYYFEALIEAFNFQISADEATNQPAAALSRLVSISNDWQLRGLFEHLTQDLLFTVIAVKSIPVGSLLRSHLITETTQYMRRIQSREVVATGNTPVFDHVQTLTKRWVEDRRLAAHTGVMSATASVSSASPAGASKPARPFQPRRYPYPQPQAAAPGLETAAAAVATAPAASTPRVERVDCSASRFPGEVSKNRNLTHNGYPYWAVKRMSSICSACYPDTGVGIPCKSQAHHYIGQCIRCNFYGHKSTNCLQTHGADGKPLP